jgi:hypothetical protein
MAYTTIDDPTIYFNTKLYSGTSGVQTISGIGFEPSWIWTKSRTNAGNHQVTDQVRGLTKYIRPNASNAQDTKTNAITAVNSDGFVLGADSSDDINANGQTYASWNWKANGQGSSNTDGSINTTYTSASTASGFSISTYTGTGANATVGHGLGAAPKVVLIKQTNGTAWWFMYHNDLGTTGKLNLNTTTYNNDLQASYWNSTAPSSSVFSLGTEASVNGSSQNFVAYCFAEKKGYSKFSGYVGNGEPAGDAPFIYTGFKPAFVMIKSSSYDGQHWAMTDNRRLGYNGDSAWLKADDSGAELTNLVNPDLLSNGFSLQNNNDIYNKNGQSYIYMAFAESPFVTSTGIPTTAG